VTLALRTVRRGQYRRGWRLPADRGQVDLGLRRGVQAADRDPSPSRRRSDPLDVLSKPLPVPRVLLAFAKGG
jgi:hypothetical protein